MKQHEANAIAVAKFLLDHPNVSEVYYPGLESHPTHELAKSQFSGFGGVISFRVASIGNDAGNIQDILGSTQIFSLAESLGGVESLIEHPATMSHASMAPELRERAGITDDLIRISVGIEHVDDLIADLTQALNMFPNLTGRGGCSMLNAQTNTTKLDAPFKLESGVSLSEVEVAYNTYGELNQDRSNAVIVLHALTGWPSAHEWWSGLIGAGKLLDPEKYFIIVPNLLGSCYGTTGPNLSTP